MSSDFVIGVAVGLVAGWASLFLALVWMIDRP